MQFRMVFLPGLNEGMFPRQLREDPLLLDEQRRALGMQPAQEDSELLRTALACAAERAVFSCARLDLATGRERVPSFFAVEVLKAARGSDADVGALLEAGEVGERIEDRMVGAGGSGGEHRRCRVRPGFVPSGCAGEDTLVVSRGSRS